MDNLEIYTTLYNRACNHKWIPWWFFTPLRRLIRYWANRNLPVYLKKNDYGRGKVERDLIVSLTSFPARIHDVWMVIETLKRQTVLPEKIILWLSKEQFPSKEDIPQYLWKEEDDLFHIIMVDGDIRSHKKYYYALKEYPEKTIITCDDDIFYHPGMVEELVYTGRLFKKCIIANICKQLSYGQDGKLLPYLRWNDKVRIHSCEDIVQIGVGGVLYPPYSLDNRVLDKDLFMRLAPLADDLWLNYMARKKGTKVVKSRFKYLPLPILSDAPTLASVNCGMNRNDEQIQAIYDYFGDR